MRNNEDPFGGIQLILCGDFLQLPPVRKNFNESRKFAFQVRLSAPFFLCMPGHYISSVCVILVQSSAWKKCVHQVVVLRDVRRQTDQKFIKILNDIRFGRFVKDPDFQRLHIV